MEISAVYVTNVTLRETIYINMSYLIWKEVCKKVFWILILDLYSADGVVECKCYVCGIVKLSLFTV